MHEASLRSIREAAAEYIVHSQDTDDSLTDFDAETLASYYLRETIEPIVVHYRKKVDRGQTLANRLLQRKQELEKLLLEEEASSAVLAKHKAEIEAKKAQRNQNIVQPLEVVETDTHKKTSVPITPAEIWESGDIALKEAMGLGTPQDRQRPEELFRRMNSLPTVTFQTMCPDGTIATDYGQGDRVETPTQLESKPEKQSRVLYVGSSYRYLQPWEEQDKPDVLLTTPFIDFYNGKFIREHCQNQEFPKWFLLMTVPTIVALFSLMYRAENGYDKFIDRLQGVEPRAIKY